MLIKYIDEKQKRQILFWTIFIHSFFRKNDIKESSGYLIALRLEHYHSSIPKRIYPNPKYYKIAPNLLSASKYKLKATL